MSLQRQITRKLEKAILDKDWISIEGIQKHLTKIITKPDNLILQQKSNIDDKIIPTTFKPKKNFLFSNNNKFLYEEQDLK